jgi:choice-of-anchor C domain-containing protein
MSKMGSTTGLRAWAAMVVACGLALGGSSPAQAASLLVNGGFESGLLTDPLFTTVASGQTNITGWTVGGDGASVDYIGSYWQPGEGSRSIDLSGTLNGTDITTPNGSLSQQFSTTAGQQYRVSFLLAGNPDNGPTVKDVGVVVGLDTFIYHFDISGNTKTNMGWTPISFLWIAPSTGSSTITFRSDTATQFGPALDAVSVEAVPLPAALPLFGGGLGLLGWMARRRRRQVAHA